MSTEARFGSNVMRAQMLAAAVDRQHGWWAKAVKAKSLSQYSSQVDVCVLTKQFTIDSIQHCKGLGALVVYDIIDDMPAIAALRAGTVQEGVDLYLTSSSHLAEAINTGQRGSGAPLAQKLPHQHSNRGWRRAAPTLPYACQVGILSGDSLNAPSEAEADSLAEKICSSGKAASVVFVTQLTTPSTVKAHACVQATEEMTSTCKQQPQAWVQEPTEATPSCFEHQDRFNSDASLASVDLGFLWVPRNDADFIERPWTRMAFWLDHNVPVVFNRMNSYIEVQEEAYQLPGGQTLLVEGEDDIKEVVSRVAGNVAFKKKLAEKGLQLARSYGTEGVGVKLTDLLAARLETWSPSAEAQSLKGKHIVRAWRDSPATWTERLSDFVHSIKR